MLKSASNSKNSPEDPVKGTTNDAKIPLLYKLIVRVSPLFVLILPDILKWYEDIVKALAGTDKLPVNVAPANNEVSVTVPLIILPSDVVIYRPPAGVMLLISVTLLIGLLFISSVVNISILATVPILNNCSVRFPFTLYILNAPPKPPSRIKRAPQFPGSNVGCAFATVRNSRITTVLLKVEITVLDVNSCVFDCNVPMSPCKVDNDPSVAITKLFISVLNWPIFIMLLLSQSRTAVNGLVKISLLLTVTFVAWKLISVFEVISILVDEIWFKIELHATSSVNIFDAIVVKPKLLSIYSILDISSLREKKSSVSKSEHLISPLTTNCCPIAGVNGFDNVLSSTLCKLLISSISKSVVCICFYSSTWV